MEVMSDTDEHFDHHLGLSSPHSSEGEDDHMSTGAVEDMATDRVKVTHSKVNQPFY